MILDGLLKLSDGQDTTTNVASTNVIDTLAEGQVGAGFAGAYFYVRVSTAFAGTGAPTTQFELQTGDTVTFGLSYSNDVTLVATEAHLVADLPAGKEFRIPIPFGLKRYVRGYKNITNYAAASIAVTASAYDMFIVKDPDYGIDANSAN